MSETVHSTDEGSEANDPTQERPQLRILRVVGDIYPQQLGGGSIHVHLLSQRQSSAGHEVTVLAPDYGSDGTPQREERAGYELIRHHEIGRPFGNPVTPGLAKSVAGCIDEYDVVHAHSHLYFTTLITSLLARTKETPLIITNHGLYSQTAPDLVQRLYVPAMARCTFGVADRVLCYTETDKRRLRSIGIETPVSVVSNGVDCERFTVDQTVPENEEVLFVGRLNRNKGPQRLVRAFEQVADRRDSATLTIAGTGPLESDLRQLVADLGLADRVRLTGRVPNDELPALFNRAAVFVLPSKNEGFPRTVLEAMACGTPPITSDLPQLEQVVSSVGRTVPIDGVSELAEAIIELLSDDDCRRELGRCARVRVEDDYSWAKTVAQTTETYYEVLDS